MKFSYNWLQSFFTEKLPEPQQLAELLTSRSFEVEEVKSIKYQVSSIKYDDYILNIDILPNRASDCLSHYGLAREVSAVTKNEISLVNPAGRPASWRGGQQEVFRVEISDKFLCPRYTSYVVGSVRVGESPDWIKGRLTAMGQKAINNVVDITNYLMWELGQPLHAFDFDKIRGSKMTIRLSKQGEKLETLDGIAHDLGDEAIVIEDSERIIDLAGIKGGANTQVENDTQKIVFQAAIFDPARIRRATQNLGAKTDASLRYMHGFDPNLPPQALERAVELLRETNPDAKIIQKIDRYPNPQEPKVISLDINYANKLLGTYLSIREIEQTLERLNFIVEKDKLRITSYGLRVTSPTYRLDISIPEDLIEEIGRIHGYGNIKPEPPRGTLVAPWRNERVFWRSMARQLLTGFGFSEVYNYSMIPKSQAQDYRFNLLELVNPVSDEFHYLRPLLLYGVLKNIAFNSRNVDSMQIFEVGKVLYGEGEKIQEGENIIMALRNLMRSDAENFYSVKGYVDEFLKKLGIVDFYFDPAFSEEDEKWHGHLLHPARRANIFIDGKFAGFVGEVHPKVQGTYDTKGRVFCVELDFEAVTVAAEEEQIYQKPSKYPQVMRDIALLVLRQTMVEEVLNVIETAGGPLLRDTDLFDMYEGENLPRPPRFAGDAGGPEGMKNLAFHLLFQSDERTLTSQEVDDIMGRITKALEDNSWEVR